MAIVQGLGAEMVVALMRAERAREPDLSWLLFGPSEDLVIEDADAPAVLAAE